MQQANIQTYWNINVSYFSTKNIGGSSCKKGEEQ